MVLIALSGRRSPSHGERNVLTQYRCLQGHSFQTVTIFDGAQFREHYAPFLETLFRITICRN